MVDHIPIDATHPQRPAPTGPPDTRLLGGYPFVLTGSAKEGR